MNDVERYVHSWRFFQLNCEQKVKGRCIINNKGWAKLREFHMEQFLKNHPSPFGFMFRLKYKHPRVYRRIPCAPKLYHFTRKQRCDKFDSRVGEKFISFPSWKGIFEEEDDTTT